MTYGWNASIMEICRLFATPTIVQQERIDMYTTSGAKSRLTAIDFRPLESASEYTTPRAASLITDNHEIIGNDADM